MGLLLGQSHKERKRPPASAPKPLGDCAPNFLSVKSCYFLVHPGSPFDYFDAMTEFASFCMSFSQTRPRPAVYLSALLPAWFGVMLRRKNIPVKVRS
jgi:hypothetical protein